MDLGTRCVTAKGHLVGAVVDLIGPVTSPYAVVAPPRGKKGRGRKQRRTDPASLVGSKLYAR